MSFFSFMADAGPLPVAIANSIPLLTNFFILYYDSECKENNYLKK